MSRCCLSPILCWTLSGRLQQRSCRTSKARRYSSLSHEGEITVRVVSSAISSVHDRSRNGARLSKGTLAGWADHANDWAYLSSAQSNLAYLYRFSNSAFSTFRSMSLSSLRCSGPLLGSFFAFSILFSNADAPYVARKPPY
jgi:hypothetical protein